MAELEGLERSGVEVPPDLLAELEREIARNEEANRIAKQREIEARAAKERAAKSQEMMASMVTRYKDIKTKVQSTRLTLAETSDRLDRQNQLTADLDQLKTMTQELAIKQEAHQAAAEENNAENADANAASASGDKKVDYASIVEQLQNKLAHQDAEEQNAADRKKAAAFEIAATVRRLEAKSAAVRAKIEQIALYEESLKTRQAQLLATKAEKEATIAEEVARKKEEEAFEMKKKVLDIQKKLDERKGKLKLKEKDLDQRKLDFDRAEKVRLGKERKIHYAEKKRIEDAMFDLKNKNKKKQ